MLNTSFVLIGVVGFIGIALFLGFQSFFGDFTEIAKWCLRFLVFFALLCGAGLYWVLPRYEFFKFIYYPIRFNRKTRKIYVFREKRDGGLLHVQSPRGRELDSKLRGYSNLGGRRKVCY
nr:DUF6708 domain-containing protein [Xanthomonas oryzae]